MRVLVVEDEAKLAGLERFIVHDGDQRRLEACQSPVWDTALSVIALTDAGVAADDPAVVRGADWLLGEQVEGRGDWAVRRPDLPGGAWSFEFDNDVYPDTDDTAEVVLALRRARHPDPARVEAAIARGVRWTAGMQSEGGGWGAFDADNVRELCRDIPFCDFGEVIDDPSADVTAHVVEMLAAEGPGFAASTRTGAAWLAAQQEPDGSWFGRWGVNHVYGTGAAVPALVAAGTPTSDPGLQRARAWLVSVQNGDGGWDEPQYTGTGFPGDFYINYELYRLVFPVMALGRWVRSST